MKINTALILCAGFGKRLNPLTLDKPKPLLELNNITLLENTINLIKGLEIKNIILNTFYLKNEIENFLKSKNFEIKIDVIDDGNTILDTGGGILNMISASKEEDFFIFNPDTIWTLNYIACIRKMENFYYQNKIKNILLVVDKNLSFDKKLNGDFILDMNLINKKTNNTHIFTGCQILNRNSLNYFDKKIFSIVELWNNLIEKKFLYGFESKNKFHHITDLEIYNKLLESY